MAGDDAAADPTAPWRAVMLVLVAALMLSGVAVLVPYDADPDAAHDSVASGPRVVRALHYWTGAAALVAAVTFAARAWMLGAERERQYPSWGGVLGGLLFAGALFLGGRILPWDQHGWESYTHAAWALTLFGGPDPARLDPADASLALVLWTHVALGLLAGLVLLYLWHRHDGRSWRAFLHRAFVMPWAYRIARRSALAVAVVLVLLAVFLPPPLGVAPVASLQRARPDWPFLWLVLFEDLFGVAGLWIGLVLAGGGVAAAPLAAAKGDVWRRVVLGVVAVAWLGLTMYGAVSAS